MHWVLFLTLSVSVMAILFLLFNLWRYLTGRNYLGMSQHPDVFFVFIAAIPILNLAVIAIFFVVYLDGVSESVRSRAIARREGK